MVSNTEFARGKYIVGVFCSFAFLLPWVGFVVPRSAALLVPLFAIFLFVETVWRERTLQVYRSLLWWAVLVFLVAAATSLFWSVNPDGAWGRIEKLILFLPIGVSLVLVSKTIFQRLPEIGRAIQFSLFAGASVAVGALWYHVLTDGGLFGLFNPSYDFEEKLVAANRPSVLLLLCLSAVVLGLRDRDLKPVLLLFILVLAAGFFLSTSQTASIGLFVWLFVFVVANWHAGFAYWCLVVGGAALIMLMPALVLLVETVDVERSIDYGAGSVGARLDIWYAVSHKILESPLWGFGLEAARAFKDWDIEFIYFNGPDIPHPHNGLLQIWLEFGVMGAMMATMAWGFLVRRVLHFRLGLRPELFAGLASFLFILSVSHGLWQSWWVNGVFGAAALTIMVACGANGDRSNQI